MSDEDSPLFRDQFLEKIDDRADTDQLAGGFVIGRPVGAADTEMWHNPHKFGILPGDVIVQDADPRPDRTASVWPVALEISKAASQSRMISPV